MRTFALFTVLFFCSFALGDLKVTWDPPTQNLDGTPYNDHSHYLLAVSKATEDLMTTGVPEVITRMECFDECIATINDMMAGLPADQYKAWVRAVDVAENESTWAVPLEFPWNTSVPMPPQNFRFVVEVEGTLRVNVRPEN